MIQLPIPSWKNVNILRSILIANLLHRFMRVRYVEPSVDDNGLVQWLIELQCILNGDSSEIKLFQNQLKKEFNKKFLCKIVTIRFNLKDRFSVILTPLEDSTIPKELAPIVKEERRGKDRSGIGFVPSSLGTLDAEKAALSRLGKIRNRKGTGARLRALEKSKTRWSEKITTSKAEQSRAEEVSQIKSLETERTNVRELSLAEESESQILKTPPVSEDVEVKSVDQLTNKSDNLINDFKKCSLDEGMTKIAKQTAQSRSYALARLNDSRIFGMARLYIAYLGQEDSCVNYEGDTKVSLGVKLLSEGLPLGSDLTTLWYEFLRKRGMQDIEIKTDLESYQSFCRTSRAMRLQSATSSARKFFGLKGGSLPPAPLLCQKRGLSNYINLDSTILSRFN